MTAIVGVVTRALLPRFSATRGSTAAHLMSLQWTKKIVRVRMTVMVTSSPNT